MLQDPLAGIVFKKNWGDYYLFRLKTAKIAAEAQPGQFLMVRVANAPYPLLRRPLSIHAKEKNTLDIFFQISGLGTAILAQKKEGETLDLLGPLGKGFDLRGIFKGRTAYLVGGGRGIAPLYFLGHELQRKRAKVRILYGGKSRADLPVKEKFKKAGLDTLCSTDDGSFGFRGFVTALLEKEIRKCAPDVLFVCGPEEMMKKTAEIAAAHKIPAQFSLESIMGCGFGACWGCVRRIKKDGGRKWGKVCEDGPVFRAEEIVWEEAA